MFLEPLQVPKLYLTAIAQRAELPWGPSLATGTCTAVGGARKGHQEGPEEDHRGWMTSLLKQVAGDKSNGGTWSQVCPVTKMGANQRAWRDSL